MHPDPLPGLRAEVTWKRDAAGPGYLFDSRAGGLYALNRTAAALLEALAAHADRAGLIESLVSRYEVDELTARQDVAGFLQALEEHELVG